MLSGKKGQMGLVLVLLSVLCSCQTAPDEQPSHHNQQQRKANDYAAVKNARRKVHWEGTYQGIFPCSDCEGVAMMLTLNKDLTYNMRSQYLGKELIDRKSSGSFDWSADQSHIHIDNTQPKHYFRVGNGFLELLTPEGKSIISHGKDDFFLDKTY